jgi:hypothetical protein
MGEAVQERIMSVPTRSLTARRHGLQERRRAATVCTPGAFRLSINPSVASEGVKTRIAPFSARFYWRCVLCERQMLPYRSRASWTLRDRHIPHGSERKP